jgi:uncharacterized membrane protein
MASTPLPMIPTDSTTSSLRRRVTAAVITTLAAVVLAAVVVASPAPAGAAPRPPADPAGAFLFRDGRFTPLGGVPGAAATGHVNLNNRGQTVGFYVDAQGVVRSFVKDRRGRVTTFAVPGASATLAVGINNRGQVAGTYFDAGVPLGDGPAPPGTIHGFIRQPSGRITTIDLPPRFAITAVTDINDRGQLVGQTELVQGRSIGFLRDPGGQVTIIDVGGAVFIDEVLALNNRGQVAGTYSSAERSPDQTIAPNSRHGFVWEQGRSTRFDVPGSLATLPLGINDAGHLTGGYADAAGNRHGFLLRRGRYSTIDAPGRPENTAAWGINDRGQIVIPELGTGIGEVAR